MLHGHVMINSFDYVPLNSMLHLDQPCEDKNPTSNSSQTDTIVSSRAISF